MKYPEATIETVDIFTPLAEMIVRFRRILTDGGIDEPLASDLIRMVLASYLEAWSKPLSIIKAPNEVALKAMLR